MNGYKDWQLAIACKRMALELGRELVPGEVPSEEYVMRLFGEERPMLNRTLIIDYTNWRGERSLRRIVPLCIRFDSNAWHRVTQWMMEAHDLERGEIRFFAMSGIHSMRAEETK